MVLFFRYSLLVFLCSYTLEETEQTMGFADFNRMDSSLCQRSFEFTGFKRDVNEPAEQIERPKECGGMDELVSD
jgi:hypothetical protein